MDKKKDVMMRIIKIMHEAPGSKTTSEFVKMYRENGFDILFPEINNSDDIINKHSFEHLLSYEDTKLFNYLYRNFLGIPTMELE